MRVLDWLATSKGTSVLWGMGILVLFVVAGCGNQTTMQESAHATPQLAEPSTSATAATEVAQSEMTEKHSDDEHSDEEHEHDVELDLSGITPISDGDMLHVVATTNIVGDVVGAVGGDAIDLKVLMPPRTDPHSFEPTPQDISAVADADIVFINGVGLETFLQPMLDSAGASEGKVIPVSHGVELIAFAGKPQQDADDQDHKQAEEDHEHTHSGADPHVWFSPISVESWVHTIEHTLSYADPANAARYAAHAAAYAEELQELDAWIMEQVEQVPEAKRKLVTDHTAFGYFAHRYGFEQVGAVIPGYSTIAEPSAKELADLEDAILAHNVPALFVGNTVNPNLTERIAQDTGTKIVMLYTGSLSEAGGPADTYVHLMRYNTQAIVDALK